MDLLERAALAGAGGGGMWPSESGRLHIDGKHFYDERGALWSWRGASEFLHFARFLRGEDPQPVFQWARARGRNVLRVLARVDPDHGWPAEWAFYKYPERRPDFEFKLHQYLDLAASGGVRVEYTVITFPGDVGTQRQLVEQAYGILEPHWNRFIEIANEPDDPDIACDVAAVMSGIDRRGILTASGYYNLTLGPGNVFSMLMYDYVTNHPERTNEWPRKDKDAKDLCDGWDERGNTDLPPERRTYWAGAHRPVVNDEREKASPDHSMVLSDFADATGVSRLLCPGSTFHCQDGLLGLPASADQDAIMQACAEIEAFIPIDAQLGAYTRGGLPDLPIVWDGDAGSLRDYASILGNLAFAVTVRPADGRIVRAAPGWRLTGRIRNAYSLERT